MPNFYEIEYIGLEDNSYKFADLLVDKAKSSSGGLFLQKNLAITGTEFTPMPITFTEDGAAVLLDEPTSLQVVISNEGNVEIYDVVAVSYTHLRAHETREDLVCRLLLEKKKSLGCR